MSEKTLIKTLGLKKFYGSGASQICILDNIDLQIYEGDFTIIMGNSGSGKSSLLYCLSGMTSFDEGSVWFANSDLGKLKPDQLALLRREMSFIFQQMNLLPNLSILENVLLPAYLLNHGGQDLLTKAQRIMGSVGIENLGARLPAQVSGGQLQRAAVARALINDPSLIFADEPTGALNSQASLAVLALLSECSSKGQSILMVTHDLKAALRGNRIIYISDGGIKGEIKLTHYAAEGDLQYREQVVLNWLQEMGW